MLSSPRGLAAAALAFAVSPTVAGCHSNSPPAPAPAPSAASSSRADLFANQDDLALSLHSSDDAGGSAAAEGDRGGEPERRPALVLTDAGAEPRAPLAYDFTPGAHQTVVVSFTTAVKEDGKAGGSADSPPLRLTLSAQTGEKPSADRTLVQVRVTKAEIVPGTKGIPPEAMAQMSQVSKALEAIGATFAVSKQGMIEGAELSGSPEAQAAASSLLPLIESALELLFVPVPADAVGIGAAWKMMAPPAPGAPGGPVAKTFVLKARTPTTALVQEEQHEETGEQPIPDPDAPPGATVAMVSKETSTFNVRLTGVAAKAASDEETVMTGRDTGSSPPKVVVTHMKRSVRLEAK